MEHERFAERAARRLEMVADRLDGAEGDGVMARAGELRVAAHLVRAESEVVSRSEGEAPEDPMTSLGHEPLEAQA